MHVRKPNTPETPDSFVTSGNDPLELANTTGNLVIERVVNRLCPPTHSLGFESGLHKPKGVGTLRTSQGGRSRRDADEATRRGGGRM